MILDERTNVKNLAILDIVQTRPRVALYVSGIKDKRLIDRRLIEKGEVICGSGSVSSGPLYRSWSRQTGA